MTAEQKNELAPIAAEVEVIDTVDDKAIVEMMTGQAIQEYVYSFKQGNKRVEGLTLAGINEAANRRGGIQVNEINYEETEHSWIATAEAIDTITGNSRYGAFEQPKMMGNRVDPFAFTKAIHKAQRNAVKQLAAELKAAQTTPQLFEQLTKHITENNQIKEGKNEQNT